MLADHVATLKILINKYLQKLSKERRLYVCFVDFKSAFDTISRRALLYKMALAGVGGHFLRILKDMYKCVDYCVKLEGGLTSVFPSSIGVKQGCVMSPILFNLFIRDLPDIFDVSCDSATLHDKSISCLMFADDLVIISLSALGLQNSLDKLSAYCETWQLRVNLKKTKIMIFNKSGKLLPLLFNYGGEPVETVRSYTYLGIVFSICGSFRQAIDHLTQQAHKALFKLKQVGTQQSITTSLKLFDVLIMPIIRYCSEVWSPYLAKGINANNLMSLSDKLPAEKLHTKFCRFLLSVNKKATNAAVRAELGRRSILPDLLCHSVKYWMALCNHHPNALVYSAYLESHSLDRKNVVSWACHIRTICCHFDMSDLWHNQGTLYKNKALYDLRVRIYDQYDTNWTQYVGRDDSKLRTYKTFKPGTYMENYLVTIKSSSMRRELTKLRISAHRLNIELGRYTRPKTPVENRKCDYCKHSVESEIHFVMECPLFKTERETLFQELEAFTVFPTLTPAEQFVFIMSYHNGDTEVLKHVLKFVNSAVEKRKRHLEVVPTNQV